MCSFFLFCICAKQIRVRSLLLQGSPLSTCHRRRLEPCAFEPTEQAQAEPEPEQILTAEPPAAASVPNNPFSVAASGRAADALPARTTPEQQHTFDRVFMDSSIILSANILEQ